MARIDFDANNVPADDGKFTPIPVGTYLLQVIDSEMRTPKSGMGEMLTLTLQVLDGPYANRLIWDNLNIVHSNEDAQRIANRALADLCLLIGLVHINDSEELHFKPFHARVGVREDKTGNYGPQNNVRYRAPASGPGGAAAAPSQPRPQPLQQPKPQTPQPAVARPQPQPRPQAAAPRTPAPGNGGPKPWQKPAAQRPQQQQPPKEEAPPF